MRISFEAAIAKAEQAATRHPIQQKTRSLYAFGSSTPRELGYLTQLSKQQQVSLTVALSNGATVRRLCSRRLIGVD